MFERFRKLLKNEKGQSLVETALVLPVILLLFCGIMDFGWILGNQLVVESSSREGARLGAVIATQSDCEDKVLNRIMAVTPAYSHSGMVVKTTLSNPANPSSGDVTVQITFTFRLLTPLAQTILGSQNYTVRSTCIMKAE